MKQVVYEDSFVRVETTGRDYDFIATVQNKTPNSLNCFIGKDEERCFILEADGWLGILADDEGRETLALITNSGINYE